MPAVVVSPCLDERKQPHQRSLSTTFNSPYFSPLGHVLAHSSSSSSSTCESAMAKTIIGAVVTWAFELSLGQPLEFLKILKQTNATSSYAVLAKDITRQKGLIGIWDGFLPWGTVQALAKGSVFGWAHALTRSKLQPFVESSQLSLNVAEVLAGGIGGGVQGLVLSPTLLLKTRVMTDPVFRASMSVSETMRQSTIVGVRVISTEGGLALMKGSMIFSLKRTLDWSSRYYFAVQLEEHWKCHKTSPLTMREKMTASLLAGVLSTVVTLPIDVIVAQIQQASNAGASVSILKTFSNQFEAGGLSSVAGFATRGFLPRVAHVALTTMLMKTATSAIYERYQAS